MIGRAVPSIPLRRRRVPTIPPKRPSLLARLVLRLINVFPRRIIYDRDGATPYLTRYYLLGGPRGMWSAKSREFNGQLDDARWLPLPFNVYVHRFHRSDDAGELHNHPWRWSWSFILAGGYSEERRVPYDCRTPGCCHGDVEDCENCAHPRWKVIRRDVQPFRVNRIQANDFHRVDLYGREAWSLFVAGPKTQSWGFWSRITDHFTPWREFIARRRS